MEPPTRLRDDDKAQKKILGTVDKTSNLNWANGTQPEAKEGWPQDF